MGRVWTEFQEHFAGIFWAMLGLVLLVAAGAWSIVRLRAQYRSHEDPAALDHGILAQIGELRRQGHLSEEEYRSIKGRLVKRLDGSIRAQDNKES